MTGIIVVAAFWIIALRTWITFGAKVPLLFILLWCVGFFIIPMLELPSYAFMSYQCVLTVILIFFERYKAYSSRSLF
jgi:hypothetical protein